MKKHRSILLAGLALLLASSVIGCGQPAPSPSLPAPPPAQLPQAGESPPPAQPPSADEAVDGEEWNMVQTFTGGTNEATPPFYVSGTEWRISWAIDAEYPESAVLELFIYRQDAPYAIWDSISHSGGNGGTVTYFIPYYIPHDETDRDFFIKVLARNLRSWTITVEDDAVDAAFYPVQITDIHHRGTVYPRDPENCVCFETVEPDEYVVIKNLGDSCQEMSGWVLKNITKGFPSFTFSSGFILCPGDIIRVYTSFPFPPGEIVEVYGYAMYPFCFHYPPGDIWDNEEPNIAVLYNANGKEVSRKTYAVLSQDMCLCR